MSATSLYNATTLVAFARQALAAAGLGEPYGTDVARVLVEGDLLGHDTHGLALLPAYLAALQAGGMTTTGTPEILRDRPAAALWDGRLLPGPWLISEGLRLGVTRARDAGTFTLSIRRSHHTASLVAYLPPVVEAGMIAIIAVSDPTEACVAPFGGIRPVLSTNPIAYGIPGAAGAVLLDVSTSATTNGMVKRLATAGTSFAHPWLIDAEGHASRDPQVRFTDPPGAILPLGGLDSGHKGTGLGMVVEALTHGLSGNGRRGDPKGWQANVFVQVLDPEAFGGLEALAEESGHLAQAIRACAPIDPARPVRVPGDRSLAARTRRLAEGVPLAPGIVAGLTDWAARLDLAAPETV